MNTVTSTRDQLSDAVHQNAPLSREGALERGFSAMFQGLVYAQIWEDPVADMEALALQEGDAVFCISSGGCNAMSYLTRKPRAITVVDLSPAHVALLRLKVTAAERLEHKAFFDFFGHANLARNLKVYDAQLAPHLDDSTLKYWEGRPRGHRRIAMFERGFYRHGALGRFLGAVHLVSRLGGVNYAPFLACKTMEEQQAFYTKEVEPLFDMAMVRFLARRRASLFGLGIPPAQYEKLAADGEGEVLRVLKERVRKLMCDFPISENYFAWQATTRGYGPAGGPVPPYLQEDQFETVKAHAGAITVHNRSMTDQLATMEANSQNGYVLLDAQDWMTDAQLTALWSEITRTAAQRATVVFRTGGTEDILPGRVEAAILDQWEYDADASQTAFNNDRSAIYGGVHVYRHRA